MAKKKELSLQEKLDNALVPNWEQPYAVPKNWVWVKLTSTFNDVTSSNKKIPLKEYLDEGDYPVIDQGMNFVGGYTNEKNLLYNDRLPIVLFGDHTRIIKFIDFPFAQGADGVKLFKPKLVWHEKCFYYALNSLEIDNLGYRRHYSIIKSFAIPLPPLQEQERIVNRIESLFAKLDKAKEFIENAIDSFDTRKSALLHQAFTGELTKKWREENGVSFDTWQEYELKDISRKITDGTHKSPQNTQEGEYMYITAKNIKESGVILKNLTFVSKSDFDEIYARCNVEKGDVLYIKDGATTGIATINQLDKPFALLSSVALIKVDKEKVHEKFLVHNLNSSKVKAEMINNMSGNAITRLTLTKIKQARLNFPSLPEQKEIVRILDSLLDKEEKAKEKAKASLEHIAHMKKAILARAFRGELGTNDENEESALELLKEVLAEKDNEDKPKREVKKRIVIPKEIKGKLRAPIEIEIYKALLQKEKVIINELLLLNKDALGVLQALNRMEEAGLICKEDVNYFIRG